jgi:hypothetical protein
VSWSFATQQLVVLSHAEAEGLLKHSQASLAATTTFKHFNQEFFLEDLY